jgi:hypothetical protein
VSIDELEDTISRKGLDKAPRLQDWQIEAKIKRSEYQVFDGRHTICILYLENGFTVDGFSACVSAANFDRELGRKLSREKAKAKIWMLEGYLLKETEYQREINS